MTASPPVFEDFASNDLSEYDLVELFHQEMVHSDKINWQADIQCGEPLSQQCGSLEFLQNNHAYGLPPD